MKKNEYKSDVLPAIHSSNLLPLKNHYKEKINTKLRKESTSFSLREIFLAGRISPLYSFEIKASATVEALMILPCVFMFMMAFAWIIDAFSIYARVDSIISENGCKCVEGSYAYEVIKNDFELENRLSDIVSSILLSEGIIKEEIKKRGMEERLNNLIVMCNITEEDIEIVVTYMLTPYIKIPGYKGLNLKNVFYSRVYSGAKKPEINEEYVYVAKDSEVYHTNDACKVLKLTVESISLEEIEERRSKDGSKYYPCTKCKGTNSEEKVYITPYGTRYHTSKECRELKRNVIKVPKSTVGGKRKCYFCGQ